MKPRITSRKRAARAEMHRMARLLHVQAPALVWNREAWCDTTPEQSHATLDAPLYGAYEPTSQTIYLNLDQPDTDSRGRPVLFETLAHELCHARFGSDHGPALHRRIRALLRGVPCSPKGERLPRPYR